MVGFLPLGVTRITIRNSKDRSYVNDDVLFNCLVDSHVSPFLPSMAFFLQVSEACQRNSNDSNQIVFQPNLLISWELIFLYEIT